ncbi:unnamed protein product [Phytomonas sp. Hart1]|nr:unnamed protein product [Phytomonas sp. Hart1]|eukprot:CCW71018.1 unnamed protein product [Phytomonas sp. isolate Hart1]
MDPTLAISSPFYNEHRATNGTLDNVIAQIAGKGDDEANSHGIAGQEGRYLAACTASTLNSHLCSFCSNRSTTAFLPMDGIYRCSECVDGQRTVSYPRRFPIGTFRCCPTSQEEGDSGVVRCIVCHNWYHLNCVGINEKVLQNYVRLSTTRWYCPEPACCKKALKKGLKKQRSDKQANTSLT